MLRNPVETIGNLIDKQGVSFIQSWVYNLVRINVLG